MTENVTSAEPEALRCARHPQVETYLRCGRCETPICPRCLIQTPVGARCRTCARVRRLPTYDVPTRFLARGAAAALLAAIIGSAVISLAIGRNPFFSFFAGLLYGYLVAEVVGLATNRKRGTSLGWVTVAAILLGYGLGAAVPFYLRLAGVPEATRLFSALALGFRPDLSYLFLAGIGALIAYSRLR